MLSQILRGWSFRQAPSQNDPQPPWKVCKHNRSGTQLHLDLQDAGDIPDPFVRRNAALDSVQNPSVNPDGYEYQLSFNVDQNALKFDHHDLVFDGLDTLAKVYLNDEHILSSDNMFQTHRVEVASLLNEGENVLRIHFSSSVLAGRILEKERGSFAHYNGEAARLHIRQAQHQWGWDWQPTLVTCGPYRPILLESYQARLGDVFFDYDLDTDFKKVSISPKFGIVGKAKPSGLKTHFVVSYQGKELISATRAAIVELNQSYIPIALANPKLWWPSRYGTPNLYSLKLELVDGASGEILDKFEKDVGFRRAKVIQEPLKDQDGTSFYFEINGLPIFAAGSNWIPAHCLESAITDEQYKDWIKLAVHGNQCMVRVWGGGNYLRTFFYDECDRCGLMIWHDFMFSDGQYPLYDTFEKSVRTEVTQQVKRLRNNCCIVIWAGNNEDYQVASQFNLTWDPDDHSGDYRNTDFPARTLYEKIFPEVVKANSKVEYHPGCPWSPHSFDDQTRGDIHAWGVWHGDQLPYQTGYADTAGRFVSEFGMQGLPSKATIDCFMKGADDERFIQSETFEFHNNADSWERRLALYIFENVRLDSLSLEDWRYASQLMQADSTTYAFRSYRQRWQGPQQRYTSGGLIWQMNDAWPCVSWAIVDFDRRPKLAYYAVKRECDNVTMSFERSDAGLDVWILSSLDKEREDVTMELIYYDLKKGMLLSSGQQKVTIASNASTKVLQAQELKNASTTLVETRLYKGDEFFCRAYDWPQPLKYLHPYPSHVSVQVKKDCLEVTADAPVKGVELSIPGQPDVRFSDNGFDLTPSDGTITIVAYGLKGSQAEARWYNHFDKK